MLIAGCASAPPEPPSDDSEELQALLEYLLEFETEDEEWVDPEEFEEETVFPETEDDLPSDQAQ